MKFKKMILIKIKKINMQSLYYSLLSNMERFYALSDPVWISYSCFYSYVYFHSWFLCKSGLRISCLLETMETLSELNTFLVRKRPLSFTFLTRLSFKGIIVLNQALPNREFHNNLPKCKSFIYLQMKKDF